jgi:segregation and condensation protein B
MSDAMHFDNEKALLEAILFLESEPVELRNLAKISGLSTDQTRTVLKELMNDYQGPHHGLEIVHISEGYQLAPKKELWERLKDRYGKKNDQKLSRAAMETLSIIAYSQPITRGEIENLRGVGADNMIKLLHTRGLITEVGKKDAPGRPIQYGTTKEFLKMFRLSSIGELPRLDEVEEERFRLDG